MPGIRRLDIGAETKKSGWETCDIRPGCDYVCNATNISSLGKFDMLLASMVLEHLRPWEIPIALKDWYNALNPGGYVHLTVPDFDHIYTLYKKDYTEAFRRLFGGSLVKDGLDDCFEQEHRWAFNVSSLETLLLEAGFDKIEVSNKIAVGIIHAKAWKGEQ
jgi:predicted SAM-dependent methyltransferase